MVDQAFHVVGIAALVFPNLVIAVVLIEIGAIDELELHVHEIVVVEVERAVGHLYFFLVGEFAHHFFEFLMVAQAHGVQHEIAHIAVRREHCYDLVVIFRPMARDDVVLVIDLAHVRGQLVENVRAHHRRHNAVARCA